MSQDRNHFANPWKEAPEKFLRPFLTLCFPAVNVVFLDMELQVLEPDTEAGRQNVGRLIRVFHLD